MSKNKSGQTAVEMAGAPLDNAPETGQEAISELIVEGEGSKNIPSYEPISRMFPFLGAAHWNTNVTKASVWKDGAEKGTVQVGLCDGAIDYNDIDGQPTGAVLPVRIVSRQAPNGKPRIEMVWPSSGAGIYARKSINAKNAPAASAELDRLARIYLKDWSAFRLDEAARVGKVTKTVTTAALSNAAVEADDAMLASLGFDLSVPASDTK